MAPRSRSRSRPAEKEASRGTDTSATLNFETRLSPPTTSSTPSPTTVEHKDQEPHPGMITTVTRQSPATQLELPAQFDNNTTQQQSNMQDDEDSRSSSLSELEDTEDLLGAASNDEPADLELDYDTEAETERLERTPQKLNATIHNSQPDKSPSKLAQELRADGSSTPTNNGHDTAQAEEELGSPTRTLFESNGQSRDGEESPSRKRKRSESAVSSLSDTDEPLAKRTQSARIQGATATSSTETLVDDDAIAEPENVVAEVEVDTTVPTERETEVPEPTVPVKGRKGRKGKRKGRRAANDDMDANGEVLVVQEEQEAEEEEEDSNRDEEIAKKRLAIDAFSRIEKEFASFREKHIKQQLQQITHELELLKQPSSTHPEYLAQLKCIDDYRDEKIRYQDTLFQFEHGALQVKTVSERQQLHSQYFQEVRDHREKTLDKCYQNVYAIQKDRRRWGADETNYAHMYVPKRAQQISQQASYNLEVSILSGVAKHVGFPAAPQLPTLQTDDVESDFKFMKIPERPVQPRILLRDVERNAADNVFFEQNAWANPNVGQMVQNHTFATPNAPNRIVSNGSTIDVSMMSAQNSQHPTPQNGNLEALLGGMSKASTHLDTSPLAAPAGPLPTVLSTTAFPTSGLHGTDGKDTPPQAPPAMSSISVGGGHRFAL